MSGHSKWANIRFKKELTDKKRGQLFTKLANAITIAAKEGGGDPEINFKLKAAIEKAKEHNMPLSNIERAIKRGTGELEGAKIEEVMYEAYGPGGIAILIKIVTDNKNRAASEIRSILSRFGGKLAEIGSVGYLFQQRGVITVTPAEKQNKEEIEMTAIDAGAEDLEENEAIIIYTKPEDLFEIKKQLEERGIKVDSATLSMEPKVPIKIEDPEKASQILKLMDALDECQDVSNLYSNFDIPAELIQKIEGRK